MQDIRRTPRRFSDEAIALFRFARWVTSRVWPGKRAYRLYLANGGLRGREVDVPVPGLPAGLEGLRIVQVSDLHAGVFLDEDSLVPVVDLVRSFEPDLFVITGDFVTRSMPDVYALGSFIERIEAPLGKFAVFGNHDYRQRREGEIASWLARQGCTALRNTSVLLERDGGRLRLVGLEDLEEAKLADMDAATAACDDADDATILLCHHPDVVDDLPPGRFDLVLSGHSHGGQINVPGLGSLGRRWMPRHVQGTFLIEGGGRLHVNRGIGVLVLPFRVGAPAEVTCCTLRAGRPPGTTG